MENSRTGPHTRYTLDYHFVWVAKYRKGVLAGEIGLRLRALIREVCRTHEIEVLKGSVSRDHVHLLLSCPPKMSPSKVMQYLKGKTLQKIADGVQATSETVLGRHLWAQGYFVASSGNVTDEVEVVPKSRTAG